MIRKDKSIKNSFAKSGACAQTLGWHAPGFLNLFSVRTSVCVYVYVCVHVCVFVCVHPGAINN